MVSLRTLIKLALAVCGVTNAAVVQLRARGNGTEVHHLEGRQATGKVQVGYFVNWAIYDRAFHPANIDTSVLTHVLYGFFDTDGNTGAVLSVDPYADYQRLYPGDVSNANHVFGAFKQTYLLKLKQRNLKTILSVGGWTFSQAGHFNFVTNAAGRSRFISESIKLMEDGGFDGIDIDFEYPTAAQKSAFASLIKELRTALDNHMRSKGESNPYLITIAVPAGPSSYVNFDVPAINGPLSFWNVMAYDYSGSWSTLSAHQANVYPDAAGGTGFSTVDALNYYLNSGATPSKVTLGIPIYGRGFANTGGIYQSFSGVPAGTWEPGIFDYKVLPRAGAAVTENTNVLAAYSYESGSRVVISYDTPNIVTKKVQYANSRGLGGTMFWELSADKTGSASLVRTAAAALGGLDQSQNHLYYPGSKYENIRNNMGQGTSTPPPSSTTTTTKPPTSTSTPPPTGGCSGVAAWSATVAYNGGQTATYSGHLWTAKWWTYGDIPGGAAGVWNDNGAC